MWRWAAGQGGGNAPKDLLRRHAVSQSRDSGTGAGSPWPRSGGANGGNIRGGGNGRRKRANSRTKAHARIGGGGGSRTREQRSRQRCDDARLLNSTRCRTLVCGLLSSPPASTAVHSDRPGSWRHSGGGGHLFPPLVLAQSGTRSGCALSGLTRQPACRYDAPTPYSDDMTPLRARVQNGRLHLDQPTGLPEGTKLDMGHRR